MNLTNLKPRRTRHNVKLLVLVIILLLQFKPSFSQEWDSLNFLDIGIGGGLPTDCGGLNAGITHSLNNFMISFFDYTVFIGQSNRMIHDLSLKFGPYLRINRTSFLAIATGVGVLLNSSKSSGD